MTSSAGVGRRSIQLTPVGGGNVTVRTEETGPLRGAALQRFAEEHSLRPYSDVPLAVMSALARALDIPVERLSVSYGPDHFDWTVSVDGKPQGAISAPATRVLDEGDRGLLMWIPRDFTPYQGSSITPEQARAVLAALQEHRGEDTTQAQAARDAAMAKQGLHFEPTGSGGGHRTGELWEHGKRLQGPALDAAIREHSFPVGGQAPEGAVETLAQALGRSPSDVRVTPSPDFFVWDVAVAGAGGGAGEQPVGVIHAPPVEVTDPATNEKRMTWLPTGFSAYKGSPLTAEEERAADDVIKVK